MTRLKKISFSILLLTIFLVQSVVITPPSTFANTETSFEENAAVTDFSEKMDSTTPLFPDFEQNPLSSQVSPQSWWNESYQYRLLVEINNSKSFTSNQPIDLPVTFTSNHAFNNSIRIVHFSDAGAEEVWTPVPCQAWNATYSGNFYTSATVTFVVENLIPGINNFYVYYHPELIVDDTDYGNNEVTSTLTGNQLDVQWKDADDKAYQISLDEDYGVYNLEDSYGRNLHTDNSSTPGLLDFTKNLVGYWSFDDNTASEQTGNVPGGAGVGYIDHGNVAYNPAGQYGSARTFDGVGDYIAINGDESLYGGKDYSSGITVMAWVYVSGGSGERIIASWDRSEYWRLAITANNRILWSTYSAGIDDFYVYTVDLLDGWHHIAASYDPGSSMKYIYLDGNLEDSTAAHTGYPLGYTRNVARYGFIGTGSEASSFDGSVGPNNEWVGELDEVRIYSTALPIEEVNLAKETGVLTDIYQVSQNVDGSVMSQYSINWNYIAHEDGEEMNINDTMTFYRQMNAYKVTRDFTWTTHLNEGDKNNDFAAWNTLYSWNPNDPDKNVEDYYFYDNQMFEGHDNVDFTPENYTVLYDYDGDNYLTALGLYITDISLGFPGGSSISEMKWKVDIDFADNIINFVPGNETDLNLPPTGPEYYLRMEFWQFIQNDYVAASPAAAGSYFENYYQTLITPLEIVSYEEQSLFFIFDVNVVDIDGNDVPGVNTTLLYSNNTIITSSLTDSNGNVTYSGLEAGDYRVNLTYAPAGYANSLPLGIFDYTINFTETTYLNTKAVSILVEMTSLELHFEETQSESNIVGAEIIFRKNVSDVFFEIGSEFTDENGNVTLRWANVSSAVSLVAFECNFLDAARYISIDNGSTGFDKYNISVAMETRTHYVVDAQIGDFETFMNMTDLSPENVYWGENFTYNIHYSYDLEASTFNISDADVSYVIQYRSDIIYEGLFANTDSEGNSYNEMDYNNTEIPLESGIEYTFRVTVSKSGFTPLTNISNLYIYPINTTLTPHVIGNPDSVMWNEVVSLSVFYNDTYYDTEIDDADVSFTTILHPEITGVFSPDGGGWYSIDLNSSEVFGEIGVFTLEISASKANYATNTTTHVLTVEAIATTLALEDSTLDVYWGNIASLHVQYSDLSNGLEGADITWELVGNPSINGDLLRNISKGDGWYSIDIDTSIFSFDGMYNLLIKASLANHAGLEDTVALNVLKIPTLIGFGDEEGVSELLRVSVSLNETDLVTFNLTYTNDLASQSIVNATNRILSWEYMDSEGVSGSGDISYANGYYVLDFDTSILTAGDYLLLISFGEVNYELRQAVIILSVEKRIIDYQLEGDIASAQLVSHMGSNWDLSVYLKDSSRDFVDLVGATVSLEFSSLSYTIDLEDEGDGHYTALMDWEDLKSIFELPELYQAELVLSKDTFASLTIDIPFQLSNREFDLVLAGDFDGQQEATHLSGETFIFT
ncbi:MAG: LamG-like jellyroll fold domain-containing protein, partial [Promethearchaeota archaeon]